MGRIDTHASGVSDECGGRVLIRTEALTKAFGGQVVLDGLDLVLRQGEIVLLHGENGSGKTTLLNVLTGCLEPDSGVIEYHVNGEPRKYVFPRPWWQDLNPFDHFTPEFAVHQGVGRTWQDIRLFGSQSLRDNIALAEPSHPGENPAVALFSPRRWTHYEAEVDRKARGMLARLGLEELRDSSADRISLGQARRAAIARAVAAGTRALFLDEPLAGLDQTSIESVLDLLRSLVSDFGITLVIVEHAVNQCHLHGFVTTLWRLSGGRIGQAQGSIQRGSPKNVLSSPGQEPSTERSGWLGLLVRDQSEVLLEPLCRGAVLTRVRRPKVFRGSSRPVLEIRHLIVRRGGRTVIGGDDGTQGGLSFVLYEGEIGILQAPNGWGKTTLVGAITGLLQASEGDIRFCGESLAGISTWSRVKRGIHALLSDSYVLPNLSAREVLRLAGNPEACTQFAPLAARKCSTLSGGEKQLLAIFSQKGPLICGALQIYDEPFSMLDTPALQKAARFIDSQETGAVLVTVPYSSNSEELHL